MSFDRLAITGAEKCGRLGQSHVMTSSLQDRHAWLSQVKYLNSAHSQVGGIKLTFN